MTAPVAQAEPVLKPLSSLSGPRKLSYVLFVLLFVLATALHLGPMCLAGLFAYLILDLAHRRLSQAMRPFYARWAAAVIFLVAATALGFVFWEFIRQAIEKLPRLLATSLPRVADMLAEYAIELPFETVQEVREAMADAVRENAIIVTRLTGLATRQFFYIVAGIIVAILCFFADPRAAAYGPSLYDALRAELHDRLRTFMLSFERVFGAQLVISGINTVVTAVFLMVVGIPFIAFLVPATFVLGLLPLVGNIASNTLIVSAALTISPRHAAMALVFLVVIHKFEYILNSRIVGGSIESPMWLTLIGILVGEILMGVPGIVLAPALLHYARVELQTLPHESRPL